MDHTTSFYLNGILIMQGPNHVPRHPPGFYVKHSYFPIFANGMYMYSIFFKENEIFSNVLKVFLIVFWNYVCINTFLLPRVAANSKKAYFYFRLVCTNAK